MVNSVVQKYIDLRKSVSSVQIRGLEKYDISSAIAIQIWKSVTMPSKAIFLRTVGLMLNEKIKIVEKVDKRNKFTALLYEDSMPMRADNKQIFDNAVSFLEPCNHINISLSNRLSLKWFVKKVPAFCHAWIAFHDYPMVQRLFFSASVAVVREVDQKCKKSKIFERTKLILVFQDHEMMENIVVQFVKNNGGKSISLQHGQRVYRKLDADYMAFDNFISDYTLLWNKFSQMQYEKANYDIERLPILGSTKYARKDAVKHEFDKNLNIDLNCITIGIMLNCPTQFGFNEVTANLLEWSQKLISDLNVKILIRIHPVDSIDNYSKCLSNDLNVVDSSVTMKEFADSITCGIGHATGSLVDLIIMNKVVFLYDNNIAFPIELPDSYKFTDYESLKRKVMRKLNELKNDDSEFKIIRNLYFEEDTVEKHQSFFDDLKGKI